MINQFKAFADQLYEEFPEAQIDIEELPSGNIWFELWINDEYVEIEYSMRGIGVSIKEHFPFTPHEDYFESIEPAKSTF